MGASIKPFAVGNAEGDLWETPTGDSVRVKTGTRDTQGSLTVLEFVISPEKGPALHTHLRPDPAGAAQVDGALV